MAELVGALPAESDEEDIEDKEAEVRDVLWSASEEMVIQVRGIQHGIFVAVWDGAYFLGLVHAPLDLLQNGTRYR